MWHGKIYNYLFSPFACLILWLIINLYILSNLLLQLYNKFICFKYVFNRIPCFGQWCFCCVSCDSSLHGCRDSDIYFLRIYVWPIHLLVKSSLCVGDLLRHHTLRGDLHWVTCLIRGTDLCWFPTVKSTDFTSNPQI